MHVAVCTAVGGVYLQVCTTTTVDILDFFLQGISGLKRENSNCSLANARCFDLFFLLLVAAAVQCVKKYLE